MGILIAQMRLAQINSFRSDLNYNIQLISATRMDLLNQINELDKQILELLESGCGEEYLLKHSQNIAR